MAITAAYSYDLEDQPTIGGASLRENFGKNAQGISQTDQITSYNNIQDATNADSFDLNPWQISLSQRITTMIAEGRHGEAIDLVLTRLDNVSQNDRAQVLSALHNALDKLNTQGFENEVQEFIGLFGNFDSIQDLITGLANDFSADLDLDIDTSVLTNMGDSAPKEVQQPENAGEMTAFMSGQSKQENLEAMARNDQLRAMQVFSNELKINPPTFF